MTDLNVVIDAVRRAHQALKACQSAIGHSDRLPDEMDWRLDHAVKALAHYGQQTGMKVGDRVRMKDRYVVAKLHPDGSRHGWYSTRETFHAGAMATVREIGVGQDGRPYCLVQFDREHSEIENHPEQSRWYEGPDSTHVFGFDCTRFEVIP